MRGLANADEVDVSRTQLSWPYYYFLDCLTELAMDETNDQAQSSAAADARQSLDIKSLTDELAKAKAALVQRDASVKAMQQKAKEYIASVDKKWQQKLEEKDVQIAALTSTVQSLENEVVSVRQQLEQAAGQAQTSTEDADVEVLRAERDVATQIAESEKARADDLVSQLASLRSSYGELQAQVQAKVSAQQVAGAQAVATIEALRGELAAAKRAETDIRAVNRELESVADERSLELASALSVKDAAEARVASLERQLAALQAAHTSLQQQIEGYARDLDGARRSASSSSARESSLQAQLQDAQDRARVAESTLRQERAEWQGTKARLEEGLAVRNSERERLSAEVDRLTRQYEDAAAGVRRLRVSCTDAEAAAAAARHALTLAEGRAADAEARYSVLQSNMKTSDGSSSKLRAEAAAAVGDARRYKAETEGLRAELAQVRGQEAALHAELQEARRAAVQLQGEASSARAKADSADARANGALQDAADHQRKRLEAKNELVAVAQALERERKANHALAAVLGSSVVPRLTALVDGVHNLAATLDSGYTGGAGGTHGSDLHRHGRTGSSSSAALGSEGEEDETDALVGTSGHGGVRIMRRGSGADAVSVSIRNGLLQVGTDRGSEGAGARSSVSGLHGDGGRLGPAGNSSSVNTAEEVGDFLTSVLDEAQAALYAATRAAADVVVKARSRGGAGAAFRRLGLSSPGTGPATPGLQRTPVRSGGAAASSVQEDEDEAGGGTQGGALGLLTSCFRTVAHSAAGLTPSPLTRGGAAGGSYSRAAVSSPAQPRRAGAGPSGGPGHGQEVAARAAGLTAGGTGGAGRAGSDRELGAAARDLDKGPGGLSSVLTETSSIRRMEAEELAWARQQGARAGVAQTGASGGRGTMPGTASGFSK